MAMSGKRIWTCEVRRDKAYRSGEEAIVTIETLCAREEDAVFAEYRCT
jgi:hypothetical protein